MLPSAAFYVDTLKDKKGTSFKITGGGFGHGAGLSQSGAAAMAKAGEDYSVIIRHFFKGTKLQDASKVSSSLFTRPPKNNIYIQA